MQRRIRLGNLIDCYGALLTPRQLSLITLSVNDDLSLAEIAQMEGISRQGVRDAIKRAEEQLEEYESKLKLLSFRQDMVKGLNELRAAAIIRGAADLTELTERLLEMCEDGV